MVGIATFRLSNAGRLIAMMQQPVTLAGLASAIVVTVFLAWPARPSRSERRGKRPNGNGLFPRDEGSWDKRHRSVD
jgi:hypothetical protein